MLVNFPLLHPYIRKRFFSSNFTISCIGPALAEIYFDSGSGILILQTISIIVVLQDKKVADSSSLNEIRNQKYSCPTHSGRFAAQSLQTRIQPNSQQAA
jgi:hypothetical protein